MKNHLHENKVLNVWMRFKPTSTDPMKYDLSVHHVTMRSVFASLVSMYENGRIAPQVATAWSANGDSSVWKMKLSRDWTFNNGDKITPAIVLRSFKRAIILKNRLESNSGFLEFLQGFKNLHSLYDEIDGIRIYDHEIVFSFTRPMPDFLQKISFGLYSIVHPSQYDDNGNWLDNKKAISSGLYEIANWDDKGFELNLRNSLPFIALRDGAIKKIKFSYSTDPLEALKADLVLRERFNYLTDTDDWQYASTMEDSNIVYVQVMKWDDRSSMLSSQRNRQLLRSIFYESLESSSYKPVKSFFPLSIYGIKELEEATPKRSFNFGRNKFTVPPFFTPLKSVKNKDKKELGEIYKLGFEKFCSEINAIPNYLDYPSDEKDEKFLYEFQFLGTGIDVNSPLEDVKFMFLSKHGIQLPDSTGEIKNHLNGETVNLQIINQYLWDQAIIWPVRHYSQGFWVKKESNVDLTNLNLSMNPIDFQFLSWK